MKKILVIQNKRIGDVLIVSIIAKNIKQLYPNSIVDYLVYDYTTGVIENNPHIDNIISVNDKELKKTQHLFKLILKIRKHKYDIIFDPYGKLQSRLICLFSNAKQRIGFQKKHKKKFPIPFYTHKVPFLDQKSKICGKVIEDRVNLVTSTFSIPEPDFVPKIYLTDKEEQYNKLNFFSKPVLMLGILGSTPQKSMPYENIATIINFITKHFDVLVLFNYSPHQKEEAMKIYKQCLRQEKIIIDIYEDSIRGFVTLMNKCTLLIANEGGTVHIAKALNKPTFTVFSPYVIKDHWASFEDGHTHTSIHLFEEKPELYTIDREERRKIEKNPTAMYQKLTPELILPKLKIFLETNLPK